MIKVLHVYKSYYPETQGGVERFIQTLAAETEKRGCENRLVTCTRQNQAYVEKMGSVKVYFYPKTFELASSPFSYALWKAFPEHLEWADVVHYHFPWPQCDLLHCRYTEVMKKPASVTYHSDVVRQKYLKYIYFPLMQRFLKSVDYIVPTSQNYVDTSETLKHYRNKIRVIPIGINPKDYQVNAEKQDEWRVRLPKRFALFVGVLRYYKGLTYLLKALEETGVCLVIAGDGPLRKELEEEAQQLKGAEVVFTGALSNEDLSALYRLASFMVIPASHRSEAYCIALVEGLMFGLPLVSTEIGTGTSFVNQQNETGLVVSPCNPKALKEAVMKLISDDGLRSRMSQSSRLRFEKLFTSDEMGGRYLDLYKFLLEKALS